MALEYNIAYHAENSYEYKVNEAFWQFMVLPEDNDSQQLLEWTFSNSMGEKSHLSINGLGFKTLQVRPTNAFQEISFTIKCKVHKEEVNPFDFMPNLNVSDDYALLNEIDFRLQHEPYLRKTKLTTLPKKHQSIFKFDAEKSVFDNLQELNHWVFMHLYFKTEVTTIDTSLEEIIDKRHGVCQDFTHLFCAIARENNVPVRYVSGYLHQGNGYFGDLQMHAWAEAYVPNGGWIGFDPTNDLLANQNHVKVAHGKDYNDCAPLKGVVYASGSNTTSYSVKVKQVSQQQ